MDKMFIGRNGVKKCPETPSEALLPLVYQSRGAAVVRVSGWSMGHLMGPACEVVVRSLDRPPRPGEIVLFRSGNGYVAHRIIGKVPGSQNAFLTKGDNLRKADPPLEGDRIIGQVTAVSKGPRPCRPWHWKYPYGIFAAYISGLEAAGRPFLHRAFLRMDRFWRTHFGRY